MELYPPHHYNDRDQHDSSSDHLRRPTSPSTLGYDSTATMATETDWSLPLHSDFTVPTSNVLTGSPPSELMTETNTHSNRRSIFGASIERKYGAFERPEIPQRTPSLQDNNHHTPDSPQHNIPLYTTTTNGVLQPAHNHQINGYGSLDHRRAVWSATHTNEPSVISPLHSPTTSYRNVVRTHSLQSATNTTAAGEDDCLRLMAPPFTKKIKQQYHKVHETRHAQSLLLGLAFCVLWTPNNIMAPNLTEMANDFGFVNNRDRDLYLGSYCALAQMVCSIPLAALIGLYTDICHSRKLLFVGTVLGSALATLLTAHTKLYWQLWVCRWITGGFMAGSVPVAFSFLGDLFDVSERNAASSFLTAMMGLGIILGQVYAGTVGSQGRGWEHAFVVSGRCSLVLGLLCLWLVKDPVRGGKEKVLQDMLRAGTRYERKLTWQGFVHAVRHNRSNAILLWQGFFSSFPWGVIFVFLNDYLSQERGFTVPDATYIVAVFGVGCAAGGILGGYFGQILLDLNRSYLPLFMAISTTLGAVPFLVLLNSSFTNAHGFYGIMIAFLGGCIASLPAVNVRPCLINVNLPESRGATLTAANLLINLGRGVGPCCITVLQNIFHTDRKFAFNFTMLVFWVISGFQLLFLMKSLPEDQDAMEAELAMYAKEAIRDARLPDDESGSLISIEDRIISFDDVAAKETIQYVREGLQELRPFQACGRIDELSSSKYNSSESSDTDPATENNNWTDQSLLYADKSDTKPILA